MVGRVSVWGGSGDEHGDQGFGALLIRIRLLFYTERHYDLLPHIRKISASSEGNCQKLGVPARHGPPSAVSLHKRAPYATASWCGISKCPINDEGSCGRFHGEDSDTK